MAGGFTAWKRAGLSYDHPFIMTQEQSLRYARHTMLPEVGEKGHRCRSFPFRPRGSTVSGRQPDLERPKTPPACQESRSRMGAFIAFAARVGSKYSRRNAILPSTARRNTTYS